MSGSSDSYGTYKMSTKAHAYYARNRWYDSVGGRFTTPDPYGGSANLTNLNSWNRYAYVGGDPVNFTDPSGLVVEHGFGTDPRFLQNHRRPMRSNRRQRRVLATAPNWRRLP